MASFEDIDRARKILGLGATATLAEIKAAYRELAQRYHPDRSGELGDQARMRELNRAYELLEDYCSKYKYAFGESEVARVYPKEAYFRWWRKNWPM
ncbi:MAG: DnaJ domain-containing protein [Dehalococcoidales bacterium]